MGMTPSRMDLDIRKGSSFDLELITQNKVYNYVIDPSYPDPGDMYRSHAENLEYHGFTYEYLNFEETYYNAIMHIRKPWVRQGDPANSPLFTLSVENGRLELTETGIKLGILAHDTAQILFDKGAYDLELIAHVGETSPEAEDIVDKLIYGEVLIHGERTV